MTGVSHSPEILEFCCPSCQAVLSVPVSLAGVEGPCPSCFRTIRSPQWEFLPSWTVDTDPVPEVGMEMDRISSQALRLELEPAPAPVRHPAKEEELPEDFVFPPDPLQERMTRNVTCAPRGIVPAAHAFLPPVVLPDRHFQARMAIPAPEEPLDESWKNRYRGQIKQSLRRRRMEDAAHNFLQSRSFQITRGVLIVLSAGLLIFLFHYLRTHEWRLPGMGQPPVAEQEGPDAVMSTPAGEAPAAPAPSLVDNDGDDDSEIPPAAPWTPAAPGPPPAAGVAGKPAAP